MENFRGRKPFTAVYTNQRLSPLMIRNFMRFRKQLFIDRLGWDLKPDGDLERDQFDHGHAEYGLLLHKGWIVGGFRATPADKPYLARDVFSHLATARELPTTGEYWEISRFGVMTEDNPRLQRIAGVANYAMLFEFAARRKMRSLIALADLTYERYLQRNQITTIRCGPPQSHEMGHPDNKIDLIVGEIPVDPGRFQLPEKFAVMQKSLEIYDETLEDGLVRGREAVSA
jgi:N-acyl-L-homoserine lactone synthetase